LGAKAHDAQRQCHIVRQIAGIEGIQAGEQRSADFAASFRLGGRYIG
jgi:hypothetical protein